MLWTIPILFIPFLGYVLKRIINAYYSRRVKTDVLFLNELKARQKAKLEEFAKKTDYYKTQALMDRYRESIEEEKRFEGTPKKAEGTPKKFDGTPKKAQQTPDHDIRQRNVQNPNESQEVQELKKQIYQQQQLLKQQQQQQQQFLLQQRHQQLLQKTEENPNGTPSQSNTNNVPSEQTAAAPRYIMPIPKDHSQQQQQQQSSPVLPEKNVNKAWYDKIVDLVIGDDPTTSPISPTPSPTPASPIQATTPLAPENSDKESDPKTIAQENEENKK